MRFPTSIRSTLLLFYAAFVFSACNGMGESDGPPSLAGQGEPATYVSLLGSDTLAVERFYRTESVIDGMYIGRAPVTQIYRYSGTIGPNGAIERMNIERSTPSPGPGSPESLIWGITIEKGSIRRTIDDSTATVSTENFDVIPTLGRAPSALYVSQELARQAKASGRETFEAHLLGPTNPQPYGTNIRVASPDSVAVDFFGNDQWVELSEDGRVLSTDGSETTVKYMAELSLDLDMEALADRWAAMDASGNGIGTPSPSEVITANVQGANIEINYSRPAMRGRVIWGGLVPYGKVWRTGANAATHFSTDQPVMIGQTMLDAGTYTLWSIFNEDSAALVINSETGQWGTQYDEQYDISREPLEETIQDDPAERFTIQIHEPTPGEGQVLSLMWDRSRFSIPITRP